MKSIIQEKINNLSSKFEILDAVQEEMEKNSSTQSLPLGDNSHLRYLRRPQLKLVSFNVLKQ